MSARPIASATVSFGLVSVPVKLYSTADNSQKVTFNWINPETGARVKQRYWDAKDERLVEREELRVGELSAALDMSQSRVSNHLRVLRESGLLDERHAGTSTHLRLERATADALLGRLWAALRAELVTLPEYEADRLRLEGVLAERRARQGDFFDRLAGEWDTVAGSFATGQARLCLATQLLSRRLCVADLGCGTGSLGVSLLGLVGRLISVDNSSGMLLEAQRRLEPLARGTRLEFRQGSFDALPLAAGEVDAALCGMVLHHLEDLDQALGEVLRVLRPGGTLAILELEPHREEWMRSAQGDRHLGLAPNDVLAALTRGGFVDLALVPTDDRYQPRRPDACAGDPVPNLPLYTVHGRKPSR